MRLVCRKVFHCTVKYVATLSWILFGWQSKKYIKDIGILHVRSGAGHGGAIAYARRKGVKILVDHSIAHSKFMGEHLQDEYIKNGSEFDLGLDSPFWRMVIEDCVWADKVLVNSYFVKDTFVEAGFEPNKIAVVYLGVRPDFFGLRKSKFHSTPTPSNCTYKLLFTGGFGFRKGGVYILEALKIINAKRPGSFTMDFVGSYEKKIVEAFEQDLNIAYADKKESSAIPLQLETPTQITFHGPVPQDDLNSYLASSDIYVFPSLAEGCASSGMEAMAAGMCVVATLESGLPITDGETGYLVPTKNAEAIADRILWFMDHPAEVDRVGANAARLIRENYTWEKYAEKVSQVYREILVK